MNEPALFDASTTTLAKCPACGATRQPNEPKAPACAHDRDQQIGAAEHRKRPHACLNRVDPSTAPIPY